MISLPLSSLSLSLSHFFLPIPFDTFQIWSSHDMSNYHTHKWFKVALTLNSCERKEGRSINEWIIFPSFFSFTLIEKRIIFWSYEWKEMNENLSLFASLVWESYKLQELARDLVKSFMWKERERDERKREKRGEKEREKRGRVIEERTHTQSSLDYFLTIFWRVRLLLVVQFGSIYNGESNESPDGAQPTAIQVTKSVFSFHHTQYTLTRFFFPLSLSLSLKRGVHSNKQSNDYNYV